MSGLEDNTIWVNVGSAAALVGATVGTTMLGAMAISKGLSNMAEADLVDPDARALQNGAELLQSAEMQPQPGRRTRIPAEVFLAEQARQQQQTQQQQVQQERQQPQAPKP